MKKASLLMVLVMAGSLIYAQDGFKKALSIRIKVAGISESENGPDNKNRSFTAGSTIYINMEVAGLQKDSSNNYGIQADFLMTGSGLSTVLNEGRIIDQAIAANSPAVKLSFKLTPGNNLNPGRYNILVTVRDTVSKKYNRQDIAIDLK